MYREHIQACNDACQSGPEETARMLRFVLATIQQQLETVPDIMADFAELGADSRFAFGSKKDGLAYVEENSESIYWDAMAAIGDDVELMLTFLRVPGLGLVKAGFACQLFAGRVGCLDVHNIRMYGLKPSALVVSKKVREVTLRRRIVQYIALCEALGGPVALWANWCQYKADVAPAGNWPEGGESVSVLHIEACHGNWWHTLPQFMLYEEEPRYAHRAN